VVLEVLRGFGGQWLLENEPQLDSPAALAATSWLEDLVRQGITPAAVANMGEPEALQLFQAGDAAFMRNWPYAWAELNKPGSLLRGKVAFTTMVSEEGQPHAATQGSWGFSLLAGSRHKAAAIEVLRFFTSAEAQKELHLRWGYTPTRLSVFEDPELLAANPALADLQEALTAAVLRPLSPVYAQLSDLLYRDVNTVITGDRPVPTAMRQLQLNSERLLLSSGGES
jgi:multiple sugar transport system substrate-binding protein